MESAFTSYSNMTILDTAGAPNLTRVTDMNYMFGNTGDFNSDISSWNVSNVTNMANMFWAIDSFDSDLSTWDVSNVTDMSSMFFGAYESFNGDLSTWNVSNVIDMYSMFKTSNFNGNISGWDVSNVNNMESMFDGSDFNSDISTWNVSNVTNMGKMFFGNNSFSSENYDALLMGWASLPSLQPNVIFGAPPTTYCAGKAGRDKLTRAVADGGYNWTITGDLGEDCSPVTSVDEEFLSNTKIYPNSTNGKISIESSFEIDKLELYNLLGAKLFSVSKTNVLDLKSLKQGVYILKVFSKDRVVSKKVIKD